MEQPELNDTSRLQQLYVHRVAARRAGGGSACVPPEAILAVVLREGSEEERLATLDHVMSCAACHREYEWLTAVDRAAVDTEARTARPTSPWWRSAPLAMAASLLVAVGAALVVRQVISGGPEPVRGTTGGIEVVGPPAEPAVGAPLTFVWRPLPEADGYILEVQRPDGAVAFADTIADTTLTLNQPDQVLPESRYRWWVRETAGAAEPRSSSFRDLRLPRR